MLPISSLIDSAKRIQLYLPHYSDRVKHAIGKLVEMQIATTEIVAEAAPVESVTQMVLSLHFLLWRFASW